MSATIRRDPSDAVAGSEPVRWAIGQLEAALGGPDGPPSDLTIVVAGPDGGQAQQARTILSAAGLAFPEETESFALARSADTLLAAGSDARGLVYALLELADRARHAADVAAALELPRPVVERPSNPIRAIARLFTSDVEDRVWWHDRGFWAEYLTELATHRVNRFTLTLGLGYNFPRNVPDAYFYFPYPFLLAVPGYDVRATKLPVEERDRNLETLRFIGEEVKRRGLHFQLALWTHAYRWGDSPGANHEIEGLTDETHAAYCRAAVRLLLREVPAVDGLTFRVHGESGIPEQSWDFWEAVFQGVAEAGRRVEIDLHAKGIDQETIDRAVATGLPVTVSPKYWAEHQGLPYHQAHIRVLERARDRGSWERAHMAVSAGARRHTRYGYTDLLREDRPYGVLFRVWPGTQRLLLWGDPAMAAGYGRYATFSGCLGLELCEPLSFKGRMGSGTAGNRLGYADESLVPEGGPAADWKKYRYTYRVWGRGTYSPETDPDGWRRYVRHAFGPAAEDAEAALANASRILLLITIAYHPSASNNRYWPEIYTNLPIVGEAGHPYSDTPSPRRFGAASPLDPQLFCGVDEFAGEALAGRSSGRYSPLEVARWLEGFARTAAHCLAAARRRVPNAGAPEWRRWETDVDIQAALGRFFAEKLRAGVAYALATHASRAAHPTDGAPHRGWLGEAVARYRAARAAWAEAAEHGRVYRDDLTYGREPWLRGHWRDRLGAIDEDLRAMEGLRSGATGDGGESGGAPVTLETYERAPLPWRPAHGPPAPYRPGEQVPLQVQVSGTAVPAEARLHFRHANQAEDWQSAALAAEAGAGGAAFKGAVPAAYAASPYPLVYYFELRDASGRAWLWPGFEPDLSNQPYFLARQAR